MHHLLHTAADVLIAAEAVVLAIGFIPGLLIGKFWGKRSR